MGCDNPTWRDEKDGTRTCSYCGSLHPQDFLDIVWRYTHGEEGYEFSTTDKGWYKFYANRPGVRNAGDGGIKFYWRHTPKDMEEEIRAACLLGETKMLGEMEARYGKRGP